MKLPNLKTVISTLSVTGILLVSSLVTANTNKTYHLKGDPVAGTKMKTVLASSLIPFNKSFEALSIEQQSLFKTRFDDLSSSDTPPFPKLGLHTLYRPIVEANQTIDAPGALKLMATVNTNGFVETIKVLNSPNTELTKVAKAVLLNTRFDPASCNGIACNMEFPLEINID